MELLVINFTVISEKMQYKSNNSCEAGWQNYKSRIKWKRGLLVCSSRCSNRNIIFQIKNWCDTCWSRLNVTNISKCAEENVQSSQAKSISRRFSTFARDLVRLLWTGLWASLTTAEDLTCRTFQGITLVVTSPDICVHCRFVVDREQLVAIADKTTYMRHVPPWLFGDLGSHLKSQRANAPSLEPETISSAEKINYLRNSLWPAFADKR